MSTRFQAWLLANTGGLQHFVNNVMAQRSGAIGRFFKAIEMGKREYGQHTLHRAFRVVNWMWVSTFKVYGMMRPIGSRFLGNGNGPLNYGALWVYCWCTAMILSRCRINRPREGATFNNQDGVEFWFDRYNMMFPPSFLNSRVSAHFIEINNIYFTEMLKKYIAVRKDVLDERDGCTPEEQRTKYILNPNYIYEPFKNDTDVIKRLRKDGTF